MNIILIIDGWSKCMLQKKKKMKIKNENKKKVAKENKTGGSFSRTQ